jgi:hypothetical protein
MVVSDHEHAIPLQGLSNYSTADLSLGCERCCSLRLRIVAHPLETQATRLVPTGRPLSQQTTLVWVMVPEQQGRSR